MTTQTDMPTYTLFVPNNAPGTVPTHIHAGSAIVGYDNMVSGYSEVDYEGNSHIRFDERIVHAAGRRHVRYPTVARTMIPRPRLLPVGTVDRCPIRGWIITEISDMPRLAAWVGQEPCIGGDAETKRTAVSRHWRKLRIEILAQTQKTGVDTLIDELLKTTA